MNIADLPLSVHHLTLMFVFSFHKNLTFYFKSIYIPKINEINLKFLNTQYIMKKKYCCILGLSLKL